MVYLPSLVSPDSKGTFHPPSHIPAASQPASLYPIGASSTDLASENQSSPGPTSPDIHSPSQFDVLEIWRGNDNDWSRCHTALKTLRSDGRRLELWKSWIGDEGEQEEDMLATVRLSSEKRRRVQWTEDQNMTAKSQRIPISHFITDEPLGAGGSCAPREFLTKVLNEHVSSILFSIPLDLFHGADMLKPVGPRNSSHVCIPRFACQVP
jgi:hypothetical protein